MFLFAKKLGNLTGGVDKIVLILYKRKQKLKEVKSITRGNCPSKRSKALPPSLWLLCAQKGSGIRDTALHHLPASRTCSSAPRQEPECRKRHFKNFFRGGATAPQNQCTGEPSCRGGSSGGGPRGGCGQPGRHPQLFRELPLAGAEIWRQKNPGENSGSTKGNFSGSPEIFPQPGEKSLK